jgi:hypothetical protein
MSDLLDAVAGENLETGEQPDAEVVYERFLELTAQYDDEVSDPTTDQVEELYHHFYKQVPDDLTDDELGLMCSIMRWLYDDLPTQHETTDPEWLRQQLRIFGTVEECTE